MKDLMNSKSCLLVRYRLLLKEIRHGEFLQMESYLYRRAPRLKQQSTLLLRILHETKSW